MKAMQIKAVDDDAGLLVAVYVQDDGLVVGVNKRAGTAERRRELQDAIARAADHWICQSKTSPLPSTKPVFAAADVTQEDIAAVEDVQSHARGAWDMVPPAEIIAAAWNRLADKQHAENHKLREITNAQA